MAFGTKAPPPAPTTCPACLLPSPFCRRGSRARTPRSHCFHSRVRTHIFPGQTEAFWGIRSLLAEDRLPGLPQLVSSCYPSSLSGMNRVLHVFIYEEKDRSLVPSPAFKCNITRNLLGLFWGTCLPKEVCGGRKGKQISPDRER